MVAITAELYGAQTPQLVQVTITGLTGADVVRVWAEPPAAPRRLIRGGIDVVPSGDVLILLDSMPELGRPIVYVVETVVGDTVTQTSAFPVTVPDPGRHVLSDPFTGESVLVDVIAGPDERTNVAVGSVLYPRGSSLGVALTGPARADSGALSVYSEAPSSVLGLVLTGRPIVSRHPNDGCDQPAVEILAVGDVSRVRRDRAGRRVFTLPYVLVSQPDPTLALYLSTLGMIAETYPTPNTLADLAGDYLTLLDIAVHDWSL